MKKMRALLIVVCIVVMGVVAVIVLRDRTVQPPLPGGTAKDPVLPPGTVHLPPPPAVVAEPPAAVARRPEGSLPFNVSRPVATILGRDGEKRDYNSRNKAMRELTRQIPEKDVEALRLFLDTKMAEQDDMKPLQFNGLKNDLVDILLRQDKIPPGMGRQLVRMYRDPEHDDVWRDYCVQYMAACYEAAEPTGVDTNEADVTCDEIQAAYRDALKETDKTIAGTALIALEKLSKTHEELDRDEVIKTALDLATSDRCSEAPRITALRICGMTGATNVLPSARIVAQAGETIMLQMAAIATVGDLGDANDRELLGSMSKSSEKRICTVAVAALGRLERRVAQ